MSRKFNKTTLSTTKPASTPSDADFAIYIDFKKNSNNPQRVFRTADALITAFERIDKILCDTIDSKIQPIMLLEEIEAGSLKIWLKNFLESVDDTALKEINWRKAVGTYLVKTKYAIIEWTNDTHESEEKTSILDLSNKIRSIAQETDVKHLPDYKNPSALDLISSIQDISSAKEHLNKEDKLTFIDDQNHSIDFNLTINWTPEKFNDFLTKEVITYQPVMMILPVKKPDYLGTSKWELRHGRKSILAKIEDAKWLKKFQNREVDVRPGDTLRCMVRQEMSYGYDNELVAENYVIIEVKEVLENQYNRQRSLFDEK